MYIVFYIKDKNILDPHFLFYLFKTNFYQNKIKSLAASRGSIRQTLKLEDLLNFEIPLPPFPIQQKIVKILDTIQEAIDIQEKIIEKTKELKKSMMAELFKYGAPSFRRGRKLKKTEIGEIPENWEVVRLGEVGRIVDGDWILEKYYSENGVRLFQVGDIGIGQLLNKSNRYISIDSANKLKVKFLKEGQILISRLPHPIGRACIVPKLNYPAITAVDVSILMVDEKIADKLFIVQILNTNFFFQQCLNLASGSTRPRISRINLEKTLIFLPPLPEQQEIAEILQIIDQKIEIEKKKKELYEELFKTMLNKIMHQEIDVEKIEI